MNQKKECTDCGEEFYPYKDKPGKIGQCPECGQKTEDHTITAYGEKFERYGGNMIYLHKTGGQIEIKGMSQAKQFASQTRRLGAGVTASLTESKNYAEHQRDGVRYNSKEWKNRH